MGARTPEQATAEGVFCIDFQTFGYFLRIVDRLNVQVASALFCNSGLMLLFTAYALIVTTATTMQIFAISKVLTYDIFAIYIAVSSSQPRSNHNRNRLSKNKADWNYRVKSSYNAIIGSIIYWGARESYRFFKAKTIQLVLTVCI